MTSKLNPTTKGLVTKHLNGHEAHGQRTLTMRSLRKALQREMPAEQAKHLAKRIMQERGI